MTRSLQAVAYCRPSALESAADGQHGLGARRPEDRLATVDAQLVPAGRGQHDAARMGADPGQSVRRGAVKPSELVESVRTATATATATATGANATIWGMLRHTLPVLLADLLAVAAACAERTGAREEIPHLARTADRRGSSRFVTRARRLSAAPAEEVAA